MAAVLSEFAEHILGNDSASEAPAGVIARSRQCDPIEKCEGHQTAAARVSVRVVRSRPCSLRIDQLLGQPADVGLRAKAHRTLQGLSQLSPAFLGVARWEVEYHRKLVSDTLEQQLRAEIADYVNDGIADREADFATQRKWIWRNDARAAPHKIRHTSYASHPQTIIEENEATWHHIWNRAHTLDANAPKGSFAERVDEWKRLIRLNFRVPDIAQPRADKIVNATSLKRAANTMRRKAAGPDKWRAELLL